jgi:putative FmdB family regulatory protein
MPIYEYVCEKCSHKFELLKGKMVKNSREKCPSCGGVSKQQLSSFGVGASSAGSPCPEACAEAGCPSARAGGCSSGGCPFSGM